MADHVDVAIVGAGQAGLATSYHLATGGVDHVILERGSVGESWRSQRWDSFCLNTPNWSNSLPGLELDPEAPDAFADRDDLVSYFERYVRRFGLPLRENTAVTALERLPSGSYRLQTTAGSVTARAVVLASGSMSRPRLPDIADKLPADVLSLSAGDYRSAETLPPGSVMVVGSGQSGCQIAEDLLEAGRPVYLCASRVARVPRAYRGRDTLAWWRDMGFLDVGLDELEDPSVRFATQPQVSGTHGGHTVSFQSLARDGATLLGRVVDCRETTLTLGGDLLECIAFADEKADAFKAAIDEWIEAEGMDVVPATADPGEPPLPDLGGSEELRELDLDDARVACVIWCTGFDADWSWLHVDVFGADGSPRHAGGVSECKGVYFIGHPWLRRRNSGILNGVGEDAARIVDHIRREVLHGPGSNRKDSLKATDIPCPPD